jgi:23S rRNA (cytidine1920-2'-O)/16S rRNA (cytidine1409-2'-O)-methyltransferase
VRRRLDVELVRRGLAPSRAQAQDLIEHGHVTVAGAPADKAARLVAPAEAVAVRQPSPWASRGAEKLLGALTAFPELQPSGRICLDAGAAAGGFTDVLLQRGAAAVCAVDVGYGQLAWHLRQDPRVVVLERVNVRHLTAEDVPAGLPGPVTLVVADLSFISLRLVLPALASMASPGADHLLLVKPQFETGRDAVGKGGVVRDPRAWRQALLEVAEAGRAQGLRPAGACCSPQPGPAGNVEFFWWLRADGDVDAEAAADAAVAEAKEAWRL